MMDCILVLLGSEAWCKRFADYNQENDRIKPLWFPQLPQNFQLKIAHKKKLVILVKKFEHIYF